jgi:hypothetical protein
MILSPKSAIQQQEAAIGGNGVLTARHFEHRVISCKSATVADE